MIAYNSDANRAIDLYAPNRFSDVWPIGSSDQWSFIQQGYPAFLAIEDMDDFTPDYHSTSDTLSTLDMDYYADYARAAIATIAHLGQLRLRLYLPLILQVL